MDGTIASDEIVTISSSLWDYKMVGIHLLPNDCPDGTVLTIRNLNLTGMRCIRITDFHRQILKCNSTRWMKEFLSSFCESKSYIIRVKAVLIRNKRKIFSCWLISFHTLIVKIFYYPWLFIFVNHLESSLINLLKNV